jgi:SAM-dependent methyltransferase
MALAQHKDSWVRFQQQVENARHYVLPFIETKFPIESRVTVLEIGCGDGGVLLPFLERGCKGVGIELDKEKSDLAKQYLSAYITNYQLEIINLNIYEEEALQTYRGAFDLIVLKDVIEHIPDQERFIPYLKQFLKPGGKVFFGFPPWYMPLGGHQQVCENKWISFLPYYHLLPVFVYKGVLKLFGEPAGTIKELLEIKSTGISIERFEKIVKKSGYAIIHDTHYLINPIYQYKFGWKPKEQFRFIRKLYHLRNYFTSCVYYLIEKRD